LISANKRLALSIIIPARNSEATLTQCLESIFLAVTNGAEIVVVNDGSDDATKTIAEKYPCQLINLPGSVGRAEARNIGAQHAKRGRCGFY
jgi:glycosyltransferase involved in cell wall biosynthesis